MNRRRVKGMGIAVEEKNTEYVKAGVVSFGVEHRLLDYKIAVEAQKDRPDVVARLTEMNRQGKIKPDSGIAIHVFGNAGGMLKEYLRFDCFAGDPHYHYMYPDIDEHDRLEFKDVTAEAPLAWVMAQIESNLPKLLVETKAASLAKKVDQKEIERAIPALAKALEISQERLAYAKRNWNKKPQQQERSLSRKAAN